MIKNENIICISSIDWDFIWQGHQEIMSVLAGNGNRVLFIENTGVRAPGIRDIRRIGKRIRNWFSGVRGFRKESDNLYVFSPMVLPFPYLRFALWINRWLIFGALKKWTKVMGFINPVMWTFLPTPLSLDIIDEFGNKVVVYYCIDNFRVSSAAARKIKKSEIKLLKKADLVFVTSRKLFDYCSGYNVNVYHFPFAVNFQEFEQTRLKGCLQPPELKGIKKPVIGYVGGVHKWLDLSLIKETAQKLPQYSFVFIGPLQTNISVLSDIKNIYFLEKKEHGQIPAFVSNFDACIIPYLITDYTRNVYPTKLNEYLAMGKPVISTALPEVASFNLENDNIIAFARTNEDFIDCIISAVRDSGDILAQKRIAVAEKNSWVKRINEMSLLIEKEIKRKAGLPFDWKESFLRLSKRAWEKALKAIFIILTGYILLFYTPLVWLIAAPLKISQPPEKSDCIVVFAGGVGESGRAGQGYEERVQYAIELYKKGFAGQIIFSSGYTYIYEEPLIMKALAVSLGIPGDAITLEDQAKNTYENVSFSKEILARNNWNKILLVSSPYHMKRVALVFNKVSGNTNVVYSPIPRSSFYAHPDRDGRGRKKWKRISLEQIRGIIHEYLGIAYYWWKGYI